MRTGVGVASSRNRRFRTSTLAAANHSGSTEEATLARCGTFIVVRPFQLVCYRSNVCILLSRLSLEDLMTQSFRLVEKESTRNTPTGSKSSVLRKLVEANGRPVAFRTLRL